MIIAYLYCILSNHKIYDCFAEYLLLSDRPDKKPSLRLPNRMPDKPRLSLPGSPEEKLRYAAPGEQYRLVCDVPDTRSRIYWFKDGVPYASPRPNVMVDNDQGLIRFGVLTDADDGVYTCVTANGESTYSTRLSINPRHRKGNSTSLFIIHYFLY